MDNLNQSVTRISNFQASLNLKCWWLLGLFTFNPKQVLRKLSPWFSMAELYEFLQECKRNFRDYLMSFNQKKKTETKSAERRLP